MTDQLRIAAADLTREQELWTFQDAIEHLLDVFQVDQEGRQLRNAKRAILRAHRGLCKWHSWSHYFQLNIINTVAPYSTGTITYDYTGGSNEREVTLASGTWPTSWTQFGQIKISGVTYDVESRVSDTVLTLPERMNPGADVAAGTSYELSRSRYPLPINWRRGGQIFQATDEYASTYFTPQMLFSSSLYNSSPNSSPWSMSIQNDPNYVGAQCLNITPAPDSIVRFMMLYERWPNSLQTAMENLGVVAVDGSPTASSTVTGTGTSFASKHKGSVLRISSTNASPTSLVGSPFTADNPYAYQRIITAIASATSITIDSTIGEDLSDVDFMISDPLDLHYETMLDAFWAMAEWEFARLSNQDSKTVMQKQLYFTQALNEARAADNKNTQTVSGRMQDHVSAMNVGEVSPLGT